MTRRVLKPLTITTICLIIIVSIVTVFITFADHPKVATPPDDKPAFSFDQSKAPEWWSGGNNWPNIDDFTGGQVTEADLPIADINVLKGTKDKPGECFVTAFYQKGSLNVETMLKKRESEMIMGEANPSVLKQIAAVQQKIETPEGPKIYTLYQYNLDKTNIQKGNEFGFIPLTNNYIEVRGICPSADQLPTTVTALAAIRLNP